MIRRHNLCEHSEASPIRHLAFSNKVPLDDRRHLLCCESWVQSLPYSYRSREASSTPSQLVLKTLRWFQFPSKQHIKPSTWLRFSSNTSVLSFPGSTSEGGCSASASETFGDSVSISLASADDDSIEGLPFPSHGMTRMTTSSIFRHTVLGSRFSVGA